jgi:hypothetical protein
MYFVGETLNSERTKVITKAKGILENCSHAQQQKLLCVYDNDKHIHI